MSRLARTLCVLYTATFCWLAITTVITYGAIPLWASIINAAAAVTVVMACVETVENAGEVKELRADLARARRPVAPPPGLSVAEQEAIDEMEAHWKDAA